MVGAARLGRVNALAPDEFAPETTYLNTASYALPAARALAATRAVTAQWAAGRGAPAVHDDKVDELRAAFARLLPGAMPDDVAVGSSVGALIGPVVASLSSGAEVVVAEGDFASVTMPFHSRGDLAVRTVPLDRLAAEVRPETALVAVSVTQSADGRTVDMTELRAATEANDARLLVDSTQASGWLPLQFADADYWVCASFKWLLGARSVSFFAGGPEATASLRPVSPGWYAAQDKWREMYAPVQVAESARRFDETPDWLGVVATAAGLELIEELKVDAIGAHDVALADRFRAGLANAERQFVPGRSPIVSVLGAGAAAERLSAAGVIISERAGALRFSFHIHNSAADVDLALDILMNN